jgi:hypothetical protein
MPVLVMLVPHMSVEQAKVVTMLRTFTELSSNVDDCVYSYYVLNVVENTIDNSNRLELISK